MAKKTAAKKATTPSTSTPAFPYTLVPNALRKFLKLIPEKPKPLKVTGPFLKTWNLMNTNDRSIITVLKVIKFLSENGDPTENYEKFMFPASGGAIMAQQVRSVYAKLGPDKGTF